MRQDDVCWRGGCLSTVEVIKKSLVFMFGNDQLSRKNLDGPLPAFRQGFNLFI